MERRLQVRASGNDMKRRVFFRQTPAELGGNGGKARDAGDHFRGEARFLQAVKDVVCGGVDRDVTEIDHRDILPARKKALELRADCPVAFFADSRVAGHGKPERQDFFFGEVQRAARNVQRQHLPGGSLRRGKNGALFQNFDRLQRQKRGIARTDADGIKGSECVIHSIPQGTKSSVAKHGSYLPGSM